jgi:hypothetical protein
MRWIGIAVLAAVSSGICPAQAPSFNGLWKLNVAKSKWGSKQVPVGVMVEINYNEPVLKYSGTVVNVHGEERTFEFAGATDGKEHAAVRPSGEGKVILDRVGPYVILTMFKSNDGAVVERTRMSLSRDSRILTYELQVTDRGHNVRWTEVYEKQ